MDNYTIIKVKEGDGFRFDSIQGAIQVDVAIEFSDGEIIEAGDFSIVATGFTESQVNEFYNKLKNLTQ